MIREHDFMERLTRGKQIEAFLDGYFSRFYQIKRVSLEHEKRGLGDRSMIRLDSIYSVEYKACERAAETGNAFVETVSVDTDGKPGWALTCRADFVIYYPVGGECIYIAEPSEIRRMVPKWERLFPTRSAQNKGYKTHGICVPLPEFKKACRNVMKVNPVEF